MNVASYYPDGKVRGIHTATHRQRANSADGWAPDVWHLLLSDTAHRITGTKSKLTARYPDWEKLPIRGDN